MQRRWIADEHALEHLLYHPEVAAIADKVRAVLAASRDGERHVIAQNIVLALFVLDGQGTIFWSYCSPIAVNPGADGILDALERLPNQENANAASSSHAA